MSYFQNFPNTNFYNQDLGWLIKKYKELNGDVKILQQIYDMIKEQIKDITIEQLEEWLDDGTLENMILSIGNIVKIIDTGLQMIDDNSLENGQIVITKGYFSVNDGGKGTYLITNNLLENDYNIHLSNGKYAILLGDYNAIAVGCDYKGINPCDTIINTLLELMKNNGKQLYFPKGTYVVNNPLIIMGEIEMYLNNQAIIKANQTMPYLIGINPQKQNVSGNTISNLIKFKIIGGILDCNDKATNGIVANKYFRSEIGFVTIKNHISAGVTTRYDAEVPGDTVGAYIGLHDCVIIGSEVNESLYGVYSSQPDNLFKNIEVINCKTGFLLSDSNTVENCTVWVSKSTLYSGSVGYRPNIGKNIRIINCTSDTLPTSILISQNASAIIKDLSVINNNSVIKPNDIGITPIIISCESASENILYKLSGLIINYDFNYNITNSPTYVLKNTINNVLCNNGNGLIQTEKNKLTINQDKLYCDVYYDESEHSYIFDLYNKGDITMEDQATIQLPSLSFMPSDYEKLLCLCVINSSLTNFNLFVQNNRFILFNDTGSQKTITQLKASYKLYDY